MSETLERLKAALAGRYEFVRELGRGATATVYLAQDLKHNRTVAIKVLHREIASLVAAERFLREIEITAGLTHPHILPLLDSGEAEGCLYYVMPYAEGESLRHRLEREGQLAADEAERIAGEVADALEYAHGQGVLHRDIKPENILLEAGHAVVSDFGIARAVSVAGGRALTDTGVTVGTPAYMSPEQSSGEHDLDARSDVYSLGCVLYEMLAGEPPFTGRTPQAVLTKHMLQTPQPIRTLRPSVLESTAKVVETALAKVPAERFATAGEFRAALGAASEGDLRLRRHRPRRVHWLAGAALTVLALAVGVTWIATGGGPRNTAIAERRTVAVLPFENLSPEEDNAFFADGIHEDILHQLSTIRDVDVIWRSSVQPYAGSTKDIQTIARELGADAVLTGSVRRSHGRVRVVVRLVDEFGVQLWSEIYERDLTIADYFAIQTDLAERTAQALAAELAPLEEERLAWRPTEDLRAYDYYQRGNVYLSDPRDREADRLVAQEMYEQAVRLDPGFALAYAKLSEVHSLLYINGYDRSDERLEQASDAVTRALELDPDLPEAHIALGRYYIWGFEDHERALREFEIAGQKLPLNVELISWRAGALMAEGKPEEARLLYRRAAELDPSNDGHWTAIAQTYWWERRFTEAAAYYDTAIALNPDMYSRLMKPLALVSSGDIGPMRSFLDSVPDYVDPSGWYTLSRWLTCFLGGDHHAALEALGASDRTQFEYHSFSNPTTLLRAWAHWGAGDAIRARAAFDSTRVRVEAMIADRPEDPRLHVALAETFAGLGQREWAIREARRALELPSVSRSVTMKSDITQHMARVYAMIGEPEAAIDYLEQYLSGPGQWSVAFFALDPRLRSIHGHPRFLALLERYGAVNDCHPTNAGRP